MATGDRVSPERRTHPRLDLDTEIWLGEDGVFTRTTERLANLSVRGAFVGSPHLYAAGGILSLRFRLRSDFVSATAIVRNVRTGVGIGVEFLERHSRAYECDAWRLLGSTAMRSGFASTCAFTIASAAANESASPTR